MNAGRDLVVDASVALKWLLPDEPLREQALTLLRAFRNARVALFAPAFIRYEVGNTLEQACRQGRLQPAQAEGAYSFFHGLDIHVDADGDLILDSARRIARETGATVYDAVYAAFAESLGVALVTADKELLDQLEQYPVAAKHLVGVEDLL
jgi:predicted nucleic acid-binding protein